MKNGKDAFLGETVDWALILGIFYLKKEKPLGGRP
jgi:hypothetical protein